MSKSNFYTLLGIVEPMITKQNTTATACVTVLDTVQDVQGMRYSMRHFRQKRTSVDIAIWCDQMQQLRPTPTLCR
jgi:hypothetical protein